MGTSRSKASRGTGKAKHPADPSRPEHPRLMKALETGDPEKIRLALTVRQRRFAEEYTLDFKGREAAIRAGYAPLYADRQAYQLLQNRGVSAYIDHLTMSKAAKVSIVNPDYIVQGIVGIVQKEAARDGDKLRGYELLARILGIFIDRQELTGKDGGPLEVEQRVKEEANDFTNMLKAMTKKKKEVHIPDA